MKDICLITNKKVLSSKDFETVLDWQYNNEKRVKMYRKYDQALIGGVYSIPDPYPEACEFDIETILKMDQ